MIQSRADCKAVTGGNGGLYLRNGFRERKTVQILALGYTATHSS